MNKQVLLAFFCMAALATAGAAQPVTTPRVFYLTTFQSPVFLTHSGDGTNRIFIVEQDGLINVFPNKETVTRSEVQTFLDLTTLMTRFHNEAGLLGLAFHPDYENNGYFFVYYSRANPNRTVVSRFVRDAGDPNRADPSSEHVILEIEQPFLNHNAGMMQFGPRDGYLYLSLGDGGDRRSGEPVFPPDLEVNGQNLRTLLSTIIRIDVDQSSSERNYGIPPDNPFAGNSEGWREEIWAYGLRNPWRFSIDSLSNQLWLADVGAKAWEEVNLVEKGDNFGWSVMEGPACFREEGCDTSNFKMPVFSERQVGGCNSITGGYVYRGRRRPELQGAYLYGDWCHGYIRMIRYEDGDVTEQKELVDTSMRISSFGMDEKGELYIVNHNGTIHWLSLSDAATGVERELPELGSLKQNHPNPFQDRTSIQYVLDESGDVELAIYDVLGRIVRTIVSASQPSGIYSVEWDGTNDSGEPAAAGVYLYSLRANGQSSTQKMIRFE